MPTIYEVQSVSTAIQFLVWMFAVIGLSKALFNSFPMTELNWWLHQLGARTREQINQLDWEVTHNKVYDKDVIAGSQQAAPRELTTAERTRKIIALRKMARGSIANRAHQFFIGCFACQSFWSACMLLLVTTEISWSLIPSAFAYSAASVVVARIVRSASSSKQPTQEERSGGCGGGGCG